MQFSKRTALGAGAAIAALAFGLPAMADHGPTTKTSSGTEFRDCGNGRSVSLTGPEVLWPPNHKFVDESVTATGNSSDKSVSLTITPSNLETVQGGDGGPAHDPDWQYPSGSPMASNTSGGTVTEPFQLRAERSGKGDGRTYSISWTATWNNDPSTTCQSGSDGDPFTVTTPHDMGHR